jgi:SagB-type dehydrogenase family enzyme
MSRGIGDEFHALTKYRRGELPRSGLDRSDKPELYKLYPSAPRVTLCTPQAVGDAGLWHALARRRSERRFQAVALSKAHLSQLLWAAQGITLQAEGYAFRTAPSAGALYPVETYVVVNDVEGVAPGVYHYVVAAHELEQLQLGDFRAAVARAALDQSMAAQANVVFAWTAIFQRSKWKYRQRAYRYIYLDAGHIAQNVVLAAVALGLGTCQLAALYDDEVNALLGVDGEDESIIYMTVVGKPE